VVRSFLVTKCSEWEAGFCICLEVKWGKRTKPRPLCWWLSCPQFWTMLAQPHGVTGFLSFPPPSYLKIEAKSSFRNVIVKLKLSHYTSRRRLGERIYSSYSLSTSALDGGERSASRPGRTLALGKGPPVPIVQEAGWAPKSVWTRRLEEKSFRLCQGSDVDRPVVQPVA
jgi:hypothetical protein